MNININELVHLPEKSFYNNNYYKGKKSNTDTELFIHCDEEYNTYDFYLCKGENKIFLGSSQNFKLTDDYVISFGEQYT
jgi:hypothetical protein